MSEVTCELAPKSMYQGAWGREEDECGTDSVINAWGCEDGASLNRMSNLW
jgi:hypothetical protein